MCVNHSCLEIDALWFGSSVGG